MGQIDSDSEAGWAATRRDRSVLAPCGMCGAVAGVPCRPGFIHIGRRFQLAICWPGVRLGGGELAAFDGECMATVESTYAWDFTAPSRHGEPATREAIVYRGACLGCGWAATDQHRDSSNAAIEDALDHALAGWRQVPIVERCAHDANAKQRAVWLDRITALYDGYGLDARLAPGAGVIRTVRSGCGTRSYWSTGFYDICAEVIDHDRSTASEPAATQLELFS